MGYEIDSMNFLHVMALTGFFYVLAIILVWYLSKNLSVEYALWFGPIIDTPSGLVALSRIVVTLLISAIIPTSWLQPVLLSCVVYSLLLVLLFSRFWLVSWIAYVLQIIACLVIAYNGLSVHVTPLVISLFLLSDYYANRPNFARYDRYILRTYRYLQWRYGTHLTQLSNHQRLTLYTIMLAENMNRPIGLRLVEWLAKLTYYRSYSLTTGIMQVNSKHLLSDVSSVQLAAKMIRFCDLFLQLKNNNEEYKRAKKVALYYNGSNSYVNRFFSEIYEVIT